MGQTVDGATCAVALEAGLWFRYGRDKRPEVTSDNTFDAVLCGERVSTTRFERGPGHDRWAALRPGELVRLFEDKEHCGRSLVVRLLSIQPINLWTCDDAILEAWSRSEGWSPARGRILGGERGAALWLQHELVWPAPTRPRPAQLSLF